MTAMARGPRLLVTLLYVLIFCIISVLNASYVLCLAIGAIAYLFRPAKSSPVLLLLSMLVALLAVVSIQLGVDTNSLATGAYKAYLVPVNTSRVLLAAAIAVFVQNIVCATPKRPVAIRLDQLGNSLAKCSYTLYLVHYPTILLVQHFGLQQWGTICSASLVNFMLVCLACVLVAAGFYFVFERHTARLRTFVKRQV